MVDSGDDNVPDGKYSITIRSADVTQGQYWLPLILP